MDDSMQVAKRLFDAWGEGGFGVTAELMDPDLVLVRHGSVDVLTLLAGEWHGLAEAAGPMRDYMSTWSDFRIEAEELIDLGDGQVAALTRHIGRAKLSGVPLDRRLADVLTVAAGRITRWDSYWDRDAGLAAHGLGGQFG